MYNFNTGEVEAGDTMSEIVADGNAKYGTSFTVDDIANLNGIKDPNKIYAGQKLARLAEWSDHPNSQFSYADAQNYVEGVADNFAKNIPFYVDASGGAGFMTPVNLGPTKGLFFTAWGVYSYSGANASLSAGPGASLTFGVGTISEGFSWGVQGGAGGGTFQAGPGFIEFGIGTPGTSLSGIYTTEVASWRDISRMVKTFFGGQ